MAKDVDWLERSLADARAAFSDPSLRAEAMLVEAANLVLVGDGEASRRFVSIIRVAADRAFQRLDVLQGEALLRRAHFLAEQVGDVLGASAVRARLAESVAARRSPPASLDLDREVVDVTVQHTLARWMPGQVGYMRSGDRPLRWALLAPRRWLAAADGGAEAIERALTGIFADANRQLSASEPADANYLMLGAFTHRAMDAAAVVAEPWRAHAREKIWEPSTMYVVDDGTWYASSFADFVTTALVTRVMAGELTAPAAVDALAELGFDRADWTRRMADPAAELRAALDHYVS